MQSDQKRIKFAYRVISDLFNERRMCLDDICFNIGAENPLLGSTSKTIEETPTITFVTDLLASEQLSAIMLA